ncbi:hypothetical protein J4457_03135 [Candidatus Woesearchaeota archaeon]|nr:hypothetical protein [Candidatus Woesearchaeota archaeon]
MVNLIGKISRGSLMDQVYLPKNRPSAFAPGCYVELVPVLAPEKITPYFYKVVHIEPLKVEMIQTILSLAPDAGNVLICGSFLERGYGFHDIDVIVVNGSITGVAENIEKTLGIHAHVISLDNTSLSEGLSTDPLFCMLLSKFVARKRVIFRVQRRILPRLLDLHLLSSKPLFHEFEELDGDQKYKMIRNIVAMRLFIDYRNVDSESVNKEIERLLGRGSIQNIKKNMTRKKDVLPILLKLYRKVFNHLMGEIHAQSK